MAPIPYGKQLITQEDINAVVETLQSDFLTQGPKIAEFEKKFADYIGCKHAVAVSNGTAALHLAAMALKVNSESNVITTPITFAASANCIKYCGGNVWFADIDKENLTLDINKVEELILSKPKGFFNGIIPVDFAGYPVNMEAFRNLANEHGLWIIEDACHAPGGYFVDSKGNKIICGNGIYSDIAIFSFHPVKHIATGEGGMITTNNETLYNKLMVLRTHGITKDPQKMQENHGGWYMEMQELGYNYRLCDIQAALGITQLQKADAGMQRRHEIAKKYDEAFAGKSLITTIHVKEGVYHAYHLYVIQVADRLGLYNFLKEKGIYAQVHYIPTHLMPYYRQFGWQKGDFETAENYYEHCLSIPMYPSLTNEEQDYVINQIIEFCNN